MLSQAAHLIAVSVRQEASGGDLSVVDITRR